MESSGDTDARLDCPVFRTPDFVVQKTDVVQMVEDLRQGCGSLNNFNRAQCLVRQAHARTELTSTHLSHKRCHGSGVHRRDHGRFFL